MLLGTLSLLPLLVPALAATASYKRQEPEGDPPQDGPQLNPDPIAEGDPENGWPKLPETPGAGLAQWGIGDTGYTVPTYISADRDNAAVTRAVMVIPARHRDCWNYWNIVNNALIVADADNEDINAGTVSIMAPCFLTEVDKSAGGATDANLLYGTISWISGQKSKLPEGADVSSYEVVDELINHYLDTSIYPNLQSIVLAGHSAGAQLVQRYAALRLETTNDEKLHFYVANPGSLLWLTSDRPYANDSCKGYDDFKYGLDDKFPAYATGLANRIGRDGIIARYESRQLHYAWGLADNGPGDTSCQARTQGGTHLERGQKYMEMFENMGGFPSTSTADWVENASHDATAMMMSGPGQERLFRTNNDAYAGAPTDPEGSNGGSGSGGGDGALSLVTSSTAMIIALSGVLSLALGRL